MDTLGVYISVPFCMSKCSFCNFASGVYPTTYFSRYVTQVVDDIRKARARMAALGAVIPAIVDSIYLGGGTPSILPPTLLKALFTALTDEFEVGRDAEITLECAPGQLEDEVLATMVEVGVNRISFGVQSFVDREAAVTGRLHNREIALRDIERVRQAGIDAISADLIAGLPLQTTASWRESLDVLAATGVPHASIYMFEVDEESRLGGEVLRGGPRYHAGAVPDDDRMAEFYIEAVEFLETRGLRQYEISNFARPGAESRHNTKYWLRQPYLGFGADAHSMLRSDLGYVRLAETDDLDEYLRGVARPNLHWVTRTQGLEEAWFLGLRLNSGVEVETVCAEFDAAGGHEEIVAALCADGLLERVGRRVRLTDRGRLLSNEVFERFLSTEESEDQPRRPQAELVTVD